MDLSVSSEDDGDSTVITVGGEVDVYTASVLREQLDQQIGAGRRHLVLDLRGVAFMDSTGLGVLVGRLKLIRMRGGTMRLVCNSERILKVFAITGLDKVFQIFDSVEAAQGGVA
ncbi:MAG TPA: STAS domain-containing protein [Segeticoccus sp.]|uniref:STAS domain-containing protein n=1 Tax=Segeticoccus sp. TaxID=2706531 RepID=UPI002D7EE7EF|nr:STAS domain-containing protein [Segeticoccus sp.]HET8600399.1 STAS domain-containing protein [Segeticoccus sp.]